MQVSESAADTAVKHESAEGGRNQPDDTHQRHPEQHVLVVIDNCPRDFALARDIFRHFRLYDGDQFIRRLADLRGGGVEGRHHPVAFRRPVIDIGSGHAAAGFVIGLEGGLLAIQHRHHRNMASLIAARLISRAREQLARVGDILAELHGVFLRDIESVVQPVQAAGCRDVRDPLLYLDDVDLDFLDGQQQRQFGVADHAEFPLGLPKIGALGLHLQEDHNPGQPEQGEDYNNCSSQSGSDGSEIHGAFLFVY